MIDKSKRICPVCEKHYFEELNAFELCPICGWGDDLLQRDDHDYKNGYNKMSVNEAKEAYKNGNKVE